jgi:hypothetical protein
LRNITGASKSAGGPRAVRQPLVVPADYFSYRLHDLQNEAKISIVFKGHDREAPHAAWSFDDVLVI